MVTTVNLQEQFVETPTVAGTRRLAAKAIGVSLAELPAPFPDSFVG